MRSPRFRSLSRFLRMFFIAISLACFFGIPATLALDNKPRLQIEIPGLKFTDFQVNKGAKGQDVIDVPWISQYIEAIYRYATSVGVIIAAVMMVIGGFQYATAGGDAGKVSAAKERITDALVGFMLVLSAFLLLNSVNPSLTTLTPVQVDVVKRDPFKELSFSMATTKEETALYGSDKSEAPEGKPTAAAGAEGDGAAATGGGEAPAEGGDQPVKPPVKKVPPSTSVGKYTASFTNCPVDLTEDAAFKVKPGGKCVDGTCTNTSHKAACKKDFDCQITRNPNEDPRAIQFFKGIGAKLTATSAAARILQVADAAAVCGLHLGSCGNTAANIYALAGVGDTSCPLNKGACYNHEQSKVVHHLKDNQLSVKLLDLNCGAICKDSKGKPFEKKPDCATTSGDAIATARKLILESEGPNGWPQSWANDLQPGDVIWIYNGNASCGSMHSMVFQGWSSPGKAQIVQGSYNGSVNAGCLDNQARTGCWDPCLTPQCGEKYFPIVRIFRPK